jgi:uncharacterized membrane protein
MHIKIALTEEIINECLDLHYNKQLSGKRMKQRLVLIPLILILIAGYLIYTELQQPTPGQNLYMAFLYIAFAFAYYFFMRKRMLKAGKQLLKGLGENATFDMEADEENVTTITNTSKLTNTWNVFTAALVSENNVLLYQANNSFTMFNYRFFEPGEFEIFKAWTREKVAPVTEA